MKATTSTTGTGRRITAEGMGDLRALAERVRLDTARRAARVRSQKGQGR